HRSGVGRIPDKFAPHAIIDAEVAHGSAAIEDHSPIDPLSNRIRALRHAVDHLLLGRAAVRMRWDGRLAVRRWPALASLLDVNDRQDVTAVPATSGVHRLKVRSC